MLHAGWESPAPRARSARRGDAIAVLRDQRVHDLGLSERADIAHAVVLARRDLAQDATHDLSAARLRQTRRDVHDVRHREAADRAPHLFLERALELRAGGAVP